MDPLEEDEGDRDPWPDEPDEFDPDSLGPRVEYTTPDDLSDIDLDRETFNAFWAVVALAKVGLYAGAVGAMLLAFDGDVDLGAPLLLVGLLALGFGYRRYRRHRGRATDPPTDPPDDAPAEGRD
ncbi:DUF7322 domain-containing protein [Halomarina ordinaria]|uniref:DUF7322 domain-containing protein n=1 Tax=Halomarina ordinaria TaxID=3033939 RepID=A0ABD5U7L8_9EURY|nr:hypothetical protein [Halomarina sp. PSRA2]